MTPRRSSSPSRSFDVVTGAAGCGLKGIRKGTKKSPDATVGAKCSSGSISRPDSRGVRLHDDFRRWESGYI